MKHVKKRDGTIIPFDESKIKHAIWRAAQETDEFDEEAATKLTERVIAYLNSKFGEPGIATVEQIQDVVEEILIFMDYPKTAKSYILYRSQRAEVRSKDKEIPEHVKHLAEESKKYFRNELSEFIYYRTYSRWIEDENRRETWIESVQRYVAYMKAKLGDKLTKEEYAEIYKAILKQEAMPSMRLLWSAGGGADASNVAGYNCSFVAPCEPRDFAEIMYLLMCGTGVGFSAESQTVQQLPLVQLQTGEEPALYVIEDSKQGWGDSLIFGMDAWYAGKDVKFDYSKLRPAGARLMTMGGRSSGPDPLVALLNFTRDRILKRQGKRLTNLDVHDIVCKIGEVVVMGGVRRSALISLSDLDDEEMRHAKQGQFYLTQPQRSMANNSAVYNSKPSTSEFLEEWLALSKSGTGERGIFNRGSLEKQFPARRWEKFGDHYATCGTNPCVPDDTIVMTSQGPRQVTDLIGKSFEAIVNGKKYASQGFFETGTKDLFEIKTNRGFSFKATDNHRVLVVDYRSRKTQRTVWKEVKDLQPGDEIVLHNHQNVTWEGKGIEEEGWLLGNLIGDGNIEASGKANLDYWGSTQQAMMKYAVDLIHSTVNARSDLTGHVAKTGFSRVGSVGLGQLAQQYGVMYKHKIPTEAIEQTSYAFHVGFLRGWFDADGSIQGNQEKGVSVRLSSSSRSALHRAQRMLARVGVISTIYENRREEGWRILPDGKGGKKEYYCNADYDLVISGANISVFSEKIGFTDSIKKLRLQKQLSEYRREMNRETFSTAVVEVKPVGKEKVYDCTVPEVHAFDGNGLYLHNCGEIILRSYEFCNLSEVVARSDDTKESLLRKIRLAAILGTFQSSLTNFDYLSDKWRKNCEEEALLGVSITGQWDCPAVQNADILKKMRDLAVKTNQEYAKRFGINPSTAVTCVKPSGTVSQLVDASSGMHPRHAPYYIRRVRISATDPLFHMLKEQKFPYHPEVGQSEESATTFVLEFPVKAPEGSVFKNDLTAMDQLEHWKLVKENFTEHNPSVTVSVSDNEWISTANWVYEHWDMVGGLSFLPRDNHVYQLAPYEEITKEQYEELLEQMPEVDFANIVAYENEDNTSGAKELACVAGGCEAEPDPEEGLGQAEPVATTTK